MLASFKDMVCYGLCMLQHSVSFCDISQFCKSNVSSIGMGQKLPKITVAVNMLNLTNQFFKNIKVIDKTKGLTKALRKFENCYLYKLPPFDICLFTA
jgi:hypothetical protein